MRHNNFSPVVETELFSHLATDELAVMYEKAKNRLQEVRRAPRTFGSSRRLDLEGEVALIGRALGERGRKH